VLGIRPELYSTALSCYGEREVIRMDRVSTVAAREQFSELVNRVAYGRTPIVLTRRGRDVALLAPLDGDRAARADTNALVGREAAAAYGASIPAQTTWAWPTTQDSQVTTGESRPSLGELFVSRALADVLRVLLLHTGSSFHQRELARMTGAGLRSVQAEARRLERLGLVTSASVNEAHPAAEDLRRLFLRSFAVPELLRDALQGFGDSVVAALLYGSVARGEETATSDVDLLVVGDVDGVRLAAALEDVERRIGRVVNATVYPLDEFRAKRREANHFVISVLGGSIVWVAGDAARLAGSDDT
jgi:prevent-host-death family protein